MNDREQVQEPSAAGRDDRPPRFEIEPADELLIEAERYCAENIPGWSGMSADAQRLAVLKLHEHVRAVTEQARRLR